MSTMFLGRTTDGGEDYSLKLKRLRTHGVVLGMTGSGKTGLAMVMLEELVRNRIPIIAIDPKGDVGNLALTFPGLSSSEFGPWADGKDPGALAERWKSGLSKWGLGSAQMQELTDRMDLRIYTPGSDSGISVDVLASLARPSERELEDEEGRQGLVSDTVSGLLGLVGKSADPVRDPEHIVLCQILERAWLAGEDLDMEGLILQLVDPPFKKIGVFPLDKFFSPDDRMELAMLFNGVVASPSFSQWTRGAAMDMDDLLAQGDRVPVSVFYLAHLADSERQFFLSLLLGRLQAWSRTQPGTESLRAVLFFDEVAGYLPPHPKNPATKGPLLTMMKQARAMGLGVVLATQNPVDIDYKALSNSGLWCVGRLRTEQDRARVLKGIPGDGYDKIIQGLDKREFLVARASGEAAVIGSRHAMCFLRGPFTRTEIAKLTPDDTKVQHAAPQSTGAAVAPAAVERIEDDLLPTPPTLKKTPQFFLDPRSVFAARMDNRFAPYAEAARPDGAIVMRPALYCALALRFDEERVGFVITEEQTRLYFPLEDALPDEMLAAPVEKSDLLSSAPDGARFAPLPEWMDDDRELSALKKRISDEVYRSEARGQFVCPPLKLHGTAGETREAFEARAKEAVEELIDDKVGALKDRYESKVDKIEDKVRDKESRLDQYESDAKMRQAEEAFNIGATILSMFGGRKKSVSSAMSKRRMSSTAKARVERTEDEIEGLHDDMEQLEEELQDEVSEIREALEAKLEEIEEKEVRLERSDIEVVRFGVLWVPVSRRI